MTKFFLLFFFVACCGSRNLGDEFERSEFVRLPNMVQIILCKTSLFNDIVTAPGLG